jgi:acetyl/propionyl-CoA carboxylase alpha subunit
MPLHLDLDGEIHAIEIVRRKPRLVLDVNGRRYEVVEDIDDQGIGSLFVDATRVAVARALVEEGAHATCFVRIDGRTHEIGLIDPREETAGRDSARDEIHAPMPGAVVMVHRRAGEAVARGETIVTIESMKLQTALAAPRDGVLFEVLKSAGDTFDKDAVLARLVPADGD